MALPISVPYSFANATTSIPLSQLDTDISTIYATVNGIGNGTVALSNVVITGGIVSNVSGISTSAVSNGTSNVSIATANGNVVVSTAGNTAITVDTSQNMTTVGTVAMASSFKRNRIINGNMLIDQRNAGASVTINTLSNTYTLDRWIAGGQATDGVFTVQQSTTAPSGFLNSTAITVTTADSSIGAGQAYYFRQNIEGYNVSDLGYGTASAQTITLSFWVRSSVTGTFGGALNNSAFNRSYPFSFTISAANTFEYKTITITGDTSGTWLTNNGIGLAVTWSLGMGSTYEGTAGTWSGSLLLAPTGAVDLISTNGATFYITGVQLEVGTKATPYEMQIYSDQLAQCQRYLPRWDASGTNQGIGSGLCYSGTNAVIYLSAPVTLRVPPTGIVAAGTFALLNSGAAGLAATGGVSFNNGSNAGLSVVGVVSSGLTAGNSTLLIGTSAYIYGTGCEL